MNNLKCKECGKVCGNQRGFDIHVAMHTQHAAKQQAYSNGHKRSRPVKDNMPALSRVVDALLLITNGGAELLQELRRERESIMADLTKIDGRIQQMESIQALSLKPTISDPPRVVSEIPLPYNTADITEIPIPE